MKPLITIAKLISLASLIFFMAGCKPSLKKTGLVQNEIDSISSRFIPDHRMGICDIRVKTGDNGVLILKGETTNPHLKENIIKTLNSHGNQLIDSIIILPDTILNKKYTGLAAISVINIRKQPDQRAELVSQAVLGTPVRILKNEEQWFLIETPDHYLGWTESSSVVPLAVKEMDAWKQSERVMTVVNSGWVYASPDESGITGDFVAGCIFVKEGESKTYTKVLFPDGREGFIISKNLADFKSWMTDVKCTGENIVKSASSFMGLPYLWGGSSSKGVDCSGFSQSVYYLNGIILFRDASLQALNGLNVDISTGYSELRPGDLLFFGTKQDTKIHVTHVAVYKGDSEYIHSSGRVMINSLDSTRSNFSSSRKKALLTARRIIGAENDFGITRVRSHPWYR